VVHLLPSHLGFRVSMDKMPMSHLGVESMASGLAVRVQTPRRAAASGDSGGGRCS
jgi:hypothetical protein